MATAVSLPTKMQAVEISAPGGPEMLQPVEIAVPMPGPGEVLIQTAFAGVNRPDVVQRMGLYPPPPGASPLPGLEVAGRVVALGEGVEPEHLGRDVCALTPGGGYAQFCTAPAGHCLPVPDGLGLAEAAAMPETLFTVWSNLFDRGFAREGEVVLLHGGTSGIGTMALALAKHFGLTMIVTCGSDDKCQRARELGADYAINYRTHDFVEQVQAITGGSGVHIVIDMVAGDYVPRNLQCLREDGRHVTIAVQGGVSAQINMAQVMMRRLTLTGSTLRPRSVLFKSMLADSIARNVWPLVEEGKLRPVMDRIFPLTEAAAAHAHIESGEHVGKIVLATH
jgi:putative PIG3 family NAD(P)H quinone oxidoreductase